MPIPKRTLAHLRKKASKNDKIFSIEDTSCSLADAEDAEKIVEVQDLISDDGETCGESEMLVSDSDNDDDRHIPNGEEQTEATNFIQEEMADDQLSNNTSDTFHLIEDCEHRDYEFICESEISESDQSGSDSEDGNSCNLYEVAIYPDATITIGESILSIMKYAVRHKTRYSALSDLLGLISLHLPKESNKEHLKSLYFLKKAFLAGGNKDDIVTIYEYCSSCFALFGAAHAVCKFCGTEKPTKRGKCYFLSLNVGKHIHSLFQGTYICRNF